MCHPGDTPEGLKKGIIRELGWYLQDNTQTWLVDQDGFYGLRPATGGKPFSDQQALPPERVETAPGGTGAEGRP